LWENSSCFTNTQKDTPKMIHAREEHHLPLMGVRDCGNDHPALCVLLVHLPCGTRAFYTVEFDILAWELEDSY
jgi:hypothetical protein